MLPSLRYDLLPLTHTRETWLFGPANGKRQQVKTGKLTWSITVTVTANGISRRSTKRRRQMHAKPKSKWTLGQARMLHQAEALPWQRRQRSGLQHARTSAA